MKPQRIKPTRSKEASLRLKLTVLMTLWRTANILATLVLRSPKNQAFFPCNLCQHALLSLDNKQGMCASKTQTTVIIQKAVFVLLRSLVLAKPTCRLVDFTQIMAPNSYLTLSSLNGSSSATFVVGDELSSTITKFFHKEYSWKSFHV